VTLLISWLVFPLVLGVLALGCGLLLELLSGTRLPGALLVPAGFAVIVVAGLFPLMADWSADLTTPALVVLAALGLVLSPPWKRGRIDGWAVACAAAVFAAFAAPIVLSGEATFAGFYTQVDSGSWFALSDSIMEHGRSLSGLPGSTYRNTLALYLPHGYPIGGFVPLGVGRELLGEDPAWLFQPYLAFIAAMLSLSLYALGARLLPSRPLRALAAFVASQPAILFGFSLWAGIKELSGAWILALTAALLGLVVRQEDSGRALLPLAVATAAVLGLLSFAGTIWVVPLYGLALALALRLRERASVLNQAALLVLLVGVLAIPSLTAVGKFWSDATGGVITGEEKGLLLHPLSWRQLFGIWPAGDFRTVPAQIGLTDVLVAIVVLAGAAGVWWAWRRRAWELPLYTVGAAIACLVVTAIGSAWVDSKALAMASPAILIAAIAGALALLATSSRIAAPAALAAVAIGAGVAWSNLLAYHDVILAPRAQMGELDRIGDRIAGQGPTLLTEDEPYGARHFLRAGDAEAPFGGGPFQIAARGGGFAVLFGQTSVDIEKYSLNGLLRYRTIVRRRSPVSSRPPSVYRRAWSGRYYEVWQRPARPARLVAHLPLGQGGSPIGRPSCRDVRALARLAGPSGRLAYPVQPRLTLAQLPGMPVWQSTNQDEGVPRARRSGTIVTRIAVPESGSYGVWMSGSFRRRIALSIDGRPVGKERTELNFGSPSYVFIGNARLGAGVHTLELRYGDAGALHPGTGGFAAINGLQATLFNTGHALNFGPLVLSRGDESAPVTYLPPSRARNLCGKTLDWIEAVAP
jgi:hypothetical protein